MYDVSNVTPEPVFVTHQEKFLIVPIIFRRQIEKYMESSASGGLGFIFGDDRERFSIIKKVWTVEEANTLAKEDLLKQAQLISVESGLELLGVFYAHNHVALDHSWPENMLSSFELVVENGTTKAWIPKNQTASAGTIIEQKVIL